LSFGKRSNDAPDLSVHFAVAITIAWAIMFLRVLVQVGVLNLALLNTLWLALIMAALILVAYAAFLFLRHKSDSTQEVTLANPFELRAALTFGAIYALILLISRTAQIYFGEIGIYVSSVLAGLLDVNAVTLSMAELSSQPNGIALEVAAEAIMLAALSNTVVRVVIVYVTGVSALRRYMLPSALLATIATIAAATWLYLT
jgi:uncharacterized membrane protein (DUF4010 family)